MKKIIIAAAAALFAFAVQANDSPAAPAAGQLAAAKQMSEQECKSAMDACKDEQCKQNLRDQNGCK